MKITQLFGIVVGTLLLVTVAEAGEPFNITSSSFLDGTMLSKKNAGANKANPNCVGENVSPPLSWTNVPQGTASFALVMTDQEGRGTGVDHWIAYGIPATVKGFVEDEAGKPSDNFIGGKGTAGQTIYLGPCVPPGQSPHHYTFILIATDLDPKALQPGLTKSELFEKLAGHVKGSTGIIGLFKNPL
ncbi:MAG: YbhB/YbcL family Raf kinase inhibitor-like protein [Afipia sp.]|nr:YbhB/YbcL family Raf kinase inhibitor-like protein [Afipia sp.]